MWAVAEQPEAIGRILVEASRPGDTVAVMTASPARTQALLDRVHSGGRRAHALPTAALDPAAVDAAADQAAAALASTTTEQPSATATSGAVEGSSGDVALVLVEAEPQEVLGRPRGGWALRAARAVRPGGIVAVLTHHEHRAGELHDPMPVLVRHAGQMGLTYLQHIVVVVVGRDGAPVAAAGVSTAPGVHQRAHVDLLLLHRRRPTGPDDGPDDGQGDGPGDGRFGGAR